MKQLIVTLLLALTVSAGIAQTKPVAPKNQKPQITAPAAPVSAADSIKISAPVLKQLLQLSYTGLDASPDMTALQAREGKKQIDALYKTLFPDLPVKPKADSVKKK